MATPFGRWAQDLARKTKSAPERMHKDFNSIARQAAARAIRKAPRETGRLKSSIYDVTPRRSGGALRGTWGIAADDAAAKLQDTGGTVRPRSRKYMAIPINGQRRQYASTVPNLFVVETAAGKFLASKPPGGDLWVRFALRKQVTVKGNRYLTNAYRWMRRRFLRVMRSKGLEYLRG